MSLRSFFAVPLALAMAGAGLPLPGLADQASTVVGWQTGTPVDAEDATMHVLWGSQFDRGLADWPGRPIGWGQVNRQFVPADEGSGHVLRVFIPAGSIDPASSRTRGTPLGGTGFKVRLPGAGLEQATLTYKVRFPADFEPGRGGKLPGLCGGACNGGGKIPNGSDGFSTRYMWLQGLRGSVYAYLPSSVRYGTSLGHDRIRMPRGRWFTLSQEVTLNTPGRDDGRVRVWIDHALVLDRGGLEFRYTSLLRLDGIYFDVFYGGSSESWAAPKDTTIEFSDFRLLTHSPIRETSLRGSSLAREGQLRHRQHPLERAGG